MGSLRSRSRPIIASTGWGGRTIVRIGVRASPMPPPTALRRKPVTRAAAHAIPTRSGPASIEDGAGVRSGAPDEVAHRLAEAGGPGQRHQSLEDELHRSGAHATPA